MFITPRPFGLLATPGTYLNSEAYSDHCDTLILAQAGVRGGQIIVHKPNKGLELHEIDFSKKAWPEVVYAEVISFQPDIVCIGSWNGWIHIVEELRKILPNSIISLEIKSPILEIGDKLRSMQENYMAKQKVLDAVIAPSRGMAKTWFPEITVDFLQHRQVIDFSKIPAAQKKLVSPVKKFVFSGSITDKRRLDLLLDLIASLPADILGQVSFDFYGDGPARSTLETHAENLKLSDNVFFKGALPQQELFKRYSHYDAGLAWVPKALYDSAPSLKLVEYCASGLTPIATSNEGHLLMREYGFHIQFFEENSTSFTHLIRKIVSEEANTLKTIKNVKQASKFDYHRVIQEEILPFYSKALATKRQNLNHQKVNKTTSQEASMRPAIQSQPVQNSEYWTPALWPFKSTRSPSSTICVAGIVSERLLYGLRDECSLVPLTEADGEKELKLVKPDILLVESCLFSGSGHWRYAIGPIPSEGFVELVSLAKSLKIPTVLWITVDIAYQSIYTKAAEMFDLIAVSDSRMIDSLKASGHKTLHLPPAIQPRLFNPIRPLEVGENDFSSSLVAGAGLPNQSNQVARVINSCDKINFTGFERTHVPAKSYIRNNRIQLSNFTPRGKLSHRMLPEVLKNSKFIIYDSDIRITPTELAWQTMENAACMCLTLNFRNKIMAEFEENSSIVDFMQADSMASFINEKGNGEVYFGALALKKWRSAFTNNTFEQRLRQIKNALNMKVKPQKELVASVVTPTMRADNVDQILRNYDQQEYSSKELIIVVNGDLSAYIQLCDTISDRPDIHICFMPQDHFAASALNLGLCHCNGDFMFRFDDDDFYGPHYISDSLLMLQADDAEVIGKFGSFVKINDSEVYMRKGATTSRSLRSFSASEVGHENAAISGATLGVSIPLLRRHPYPDESLASADSAFLERIRTRSPETRILKNDWYNFTIGRDEDSASHTWRVELSSLIAKDKLVLEEVDEVSR